MLASKLKRTGALLAGLALFISTADGAHAAQGESVPDLMRELAEKYGDKEKKYDNLAKKVDKAVQRALSEGSWQSGPEEGTERPLLEHPWLARVEALAEAARARAKVRKNTGATEALLERFPWAKELELVQGLQFGSDRPIPKHDSGFIELGGPRGDVPGFPELTTNHYLYGLQEIVGWRFQVQVKRGPSYEGREPRDRPEMESQLPGWERLRVYLTGYPPEVPLFAIQELTHRIHSRLLERRRQKGELAPLDRFLAFLDSKWNGFQVALPYTKELNAIAYPAHALMSDAKGFAYRFQRSSHLANVGDLPFLSVPTYQQYAIEFHGESVTPSDFISKRPTAMKMQAQLQTDGAYVKRYISLIDEFVRAVLVPDLPYPEYMRYLDYPEGRLPTERVLNREYDVPRKHALLVWAHVGGDPEKLADFLYDSLLSKEANAFPNDVALPVELTLLVREMEQELLVSVAAQADGSDFSREFSPHPVYREPRGKPASEFLAHSFHTFHAPVTAAIRAAALEVVLEELE